MSARRVDPREAFEELSPSLRAALLFWISVVLVPAQSVYRASSYSLKHDFEQDTITTGLDWLYVSSPAFAGAMVASGYPIVGVRGGGRNFLFCVRPRFRRNKMSRGVRYSTPRESIVHASPEEREVFAVLVAAARGRLEVAA